MSAPIAPIVTTTLTPAQDANAQRRRQFERSAPRVGLGRGVGAVLMVACSLATALPLVLLLVNSLKTNGEITLDPIALPASPQWTNFVEAWGGGASGGTLARAFFNSVVVTGGTVAVVTVLAALAGYALGSFTFRGERFVTQGILILLAVPTQATLVPIFYSLDQWGLRNTYVGIILVYTAFWLPFSVLLLRAAFRAFPRELLEAARVDGAGELTTLMRIVAPILRGPIAGVAIVNAIGIWSELLFAYVLLTNPKMQTLPAAIIAFSGSFVTDYRLLYAGLVISVLPVLIFYVALSNIIRKGVSAGSIK